MLGIAGFLELYPPEPDYDINQILVYVGFALTFFAWLIMLIGTLFRGV